MNTRLIFAAAVVIGMSGCATQSTGGSKLDHGQLIAEQRVARDTIEVCDQLGSVITCRSEDRQQVEDDLEYLIQSMQYDR